MSRVASRRKCRCPSARKSRRDLFMLGFELPSSGNSPKSSCACFRWARNNAYAKARVKYPLSRGTGAWPDSSYTTALTPLYRLHTNDQRCLLLPDASDSQTCCSLDRSRTLAVCRSLTDRAAAIALFACTPAADPDIPGALQPIAPSRSRDNRDSPSADTR